MDMLILELVKFWFNFFYFLIMWVFLVLMIYVLYFGIKVCNSRMVKKIEKKKEFVKFKFKYY